MPTRNGDFDVTHEAIFESITRDIRISVEPLYVDDHSAPEENHFVWQYTIKISNEGKQSVKLLSRVWQITDALGRVQEVRGKGVVGETPLIEPGNSFSYTSGCPLETPSGIMVGSYRMIGEDGVRFDVSIPAFSLDSPHSVRTLN